MLGPSIKYDFHCTVLHLSHKCSTDLANNVYNEFYPNQSKISKVRVEIYLHP